MDVDWALTELRAFAEMTAVGRPTSGGRAVVVGGSSPRAAESDIIAAAQVVEKILDRVLPRWRELPEDRRRRWSRHREAALRAITELERQNEVAERLGDTGPTISASGLHPWVWEAARSLWQSNHYLQAVQAAAVKINAETQNKIGRRDISESDLFKQAYSDDPPQPGKARLRPAEDDDGKTSRSKRRGVAAFAEGCFAAIRNPLSHDALGDITEQDAVEMLAALSVLARWVDNSSVISV